MLRIFDFRIAAHGFHATPISESERIMSKVSTKSQLQWKAAIDQDLLAENISKNSDTAVKGNAKLFAVGAVIDLVIVGGVVERD